jgi:hypothetical protein
MVHAKIPHTFCDDWFTAVQSRAQTEAFLRATLLLVFSLWLRKRRR